MGTGHAGAWDAASGFDQFPVMTGRAGASHLWQASRFLKVVLLRSE